MKIGTWTLRQQVYRVEQRDGDDIVVIHHYGIYEDYGLQTGTSNPDLLPKIPRPEQVW